MELELEALEMLKSVTEKVPTTRAEPLPCAAGWPAPSCSSSPSCADR